MAFVITRLCRDCVDTSCVSVCPVDCIVRPKPAASAAYPNQLFIHPDECIDCNACVPACPWEAIYEDSEVPAPLRDDIALNARVAERPDDFEVAEHLEHDTPSPEEVRANHAKWRDERGEEPPLARISTTRPMRTKSG